MAIWDDVVPLSDREKYGKYTKLANVGMGRKPAVVVVDMTESFIDERYSTGCGEPARDAVRATGKLLDHARKRNVRRIFATWDPGLLPEEIGFWKCQRPQPVTTDEPVLLRGKPSAFFGTNLAGILTFYGADTVIVAGISTSGCVRATVIDAFSLNYRVIVPEECVADRVVVPHKVNLFDMQMKYADVLPLDQVIALLQVNAPAALKK
jgi:maleamate amidohydrolase